MVAKPWDLPREVLEGEDLIYLGGSQASYMLMVKKSSCDKESEIFSCSEKISSYWL